MYNWISLLYSKNYHNIVNQVHFNKTKKLMVEKFLSLFHEVIVTNSKLGMKKNSGY